MGRIGRLEYSHKTHAGIKRDKFFVSANGISPIREEMYWPLDPPIETVEEARTGVDDVGTQRQYLEAFLDERRCSP